jgi:hypothetical protein
MPKHPLAEVFGFPLDNFSPEAERYRKHRLCPYFNKVANCTKDKANDPLGVCSVYEDAGIAITCPVRFRQDWLIAEDAAQFFFPTQTKWTSLTEVRLNDKQGKSAGNIDVVLVAYNNQGRILDFGALEVQAVYISGNIRRPFEHYMEDPVSRHNMDWSKGIHYPRPDYLSSSRKRLAPQLIYKGGILKTWRKKQDVALHRGFYNTLPEMAEVEPQNADIAWLIYDLNLDLQQHRYKLNRYRTVYTLFEPALQKITNPDAGQIEEFIEHLQGKLDEKIENGNPPEAPTLTDIINQ